MTERRDDDAPLDLSAWSAPTPPRGMAGRVMDAVRTSAEAPDDARPSTRATPSPGPTGKPTWRAIAIGLTAAAAAAAIAWAAWPRPRDSGPSTGHVVAGAPSKLTLGNGTVALLGIGADVTWERTHAGLVVTQAAGNVTYQHPGPSRLVITTPLAEVHTAGASLNVEVPMSSKKVAFAGVAGAGVAAAIVVAVYEGKAEVREPTTSARVVEAGGQVAVAPPSAPKPAAFTPVAKAVKDRVQRDALAAAIASRRAAVAAGTTAPAGIGLPAGTALAPAAPVDLTPGQLSKEEIRTGVREVVPLLTDCYTLMLDKHPRMGGRVVAKLIVDAEPDLGTIITMQDDTEVAMKGAAADFDARELQTDLADFRQCLGATLETVALPPLGDKDGGHVEITYPFVFAPSEEEAEQYNDDSKPPPPPPGPTQKQARTDPPPPTPGPGVTAEDLLAESEDAAKRSQWKLALTRSEQAMNVDGAAKQTVARAAMVATLAACNLGLATKARRYFPRATPAAKTLIEQRCLASKIDITPGKGNDDNGVMNPFQ